jgi:hypothetical protein
VVGPVSAIAALAGDWAGDYSSVETGRSGSITFTLRAAGDSAYGDVVMIPRPSNHPLAPWRDQNVSMSPLAPTTLTIRFVRVDGEHVSGRLEPYADPQTGDRLVTTFRGDLQGNTITGTYTTRLPSGETQTGRWTVQRS